ncbi:hypothetical protein E1293_02275 [Actinomadura darangshiensis]|uniref:Rpn family recombination-promoting nuclease/putative transposase n=1 Tax=Actinomadura darangshiensis TaxID=705336 RepID=A0A4R5BWC1_9ACTN|nr:hypothetical protein [Actinomadura darangshiensis]TDD91431.1 hypothetical protein E1293_02275 [Actinomadura darangshiensis]
MPTTDHELPLEMVRNRPQLVPIILRNVFGLDVPDGRVTLTSESYAGLNPAELRCDATVLLDDPEAPSFGVVVESQLRFKEDKLFSWPAYLALLRLRRKCGVSLLVFCPDQKIAEACAAPIDMGHPDWVLKPLTVHPGMLPAITDPARACRLPELAVFSAPAHADGPHAQAVVSSLSAALGTLSGDTGALYNDYIMSRLSDAARKLLEETMKLENHEWQSDFALRHIAEGKAEGKAEGEARSVLLVLDARGISVPNDVRERICECSDTDQLERWLQRAATITSAEELLD